jgi:hypothetical protein
MKSVIAWDIETAPNPDALAAYIMEADAVAQLVERGAGACTPEAVATATEAFRAQSDKGWRYGRTKDPDKLHAALRLDYETLVEKASKSCSFDPLRGRIVCAAVYGRRPGEEPFGAVRTLADFDGDEAALLRWQWSILGRADSIVTWNGVGFDARFLTIRSAILGVEAPRLIDTARFKYAPVCDLMQWFAGWDRSRWVGLDKVCVATGIGTGKGGMDGSQVAGFVEDGRWDEIAAYCLGDVEARTWPLYERFAPYIPGHEAFGKALAAQPEPTTNTTDTAAE